MSEERRCDVAIIGGGLAGLLTANRLAQLGMTPVVLEQSGEERYLCNTRYTGGTFHVCLRDIMLEENTLKDAITRTTDGFVSDIWARSIARECRRAVRWLQEEGVRFMKVSAAEHHKWVLAPPGRNGPGLDWKGRSGDVLLRTLETNLAKRGGALVRNVQARSLLMENGACRGLIAQHDGSEVCYRTTRAVVIADGGFQSNLELIGSHICQRPQALQQRNAGTAQGDGLKMALAAGARLVGTDRFYGHVLSRDAFTNDRLWPYPYLDALATVGIVVDANGRRFVDEGRGGVYIANAIAQLPDPLSSVVVFDSAIWEGAGRAGLIPPNPHVSAVGGTVVNGADLETLARRLGMDASHLKETVRAYNESIATGETSKLDPPRSTIRHTPVPIEFGPFYAVPACCGITATMGGIAIDEYARAVRDDGAFIDRLYVAGGAAGGLEGGPEVGYVGGLVKCGVTGLIAAEHIAAGQRVV
jgi:fumarate reductase flavoprotein subunit